MEKGGKVVRLFTAVCGWYYPKVHAPSVVARSMYPLHLSLGEERHPPLPTATQASWDVSPGFK